MNLPEVKAMLSLVQFCMGDHNDIDQIQFCFFLVKQKLSSRYAGGSTENPTTLDSIVAWHLTEHWASF